MTILQKWAVLRKGWDEAVLTAVARPEGGLTMAKLPDVDEWAREAGKKGAQYALELLEQEYGVSAARLRELAEADRDGRCVVLPAPLGSQVWQFKYPTRIDENGEEWTICSVRKATVEPAPFGLTLSMVNQIGKIYWLSEEDALAALRREQDG